MLAAARDLYGLMPADFTAARNQLAKALKADGQPDEAKTVASLRRPKMSEYALNRIARSDSAVVRRFADAVVAAQRAQAAAIGGDAAALRDATNALRQANAAVVDAAVRGLVSEGGNGETQRDEIGLLLREFISGANTAPLVAGVIGSEALIAADGIFPGAPDPPHDRATKAKLTLAPKLPPEPTAAAKSTAAAKQAMQRAERTRLTDAVRSAEAAVAKASAAVEQVQADLLARRADLRMAQGLQKAAAKELADFDPD